MEWSNFKKNEMKNLKIKNFVLNTVIILIILAFILFILTNKRYEYLELLNF